MITINIPIIENHFWPCWFIKFVKESPNLEAKYETIKNLKPLEIKLIKTKITKLKLIKPLVIVKTLYGKGVKPAKNKIASQV